MTAIPVFSRLKRLKNLYQNYKSLDGCQRLMNNENVIE